MHHIFGLFGFGCDLNCVQCMRDLSHSSCVQPLAVQLPLAVLQGFIAEAGCVPFKKGGSLHFQAHILDQFTCIFGL